MDSELAREDAHAFYGFNRPYSHKGTTINNSAHHLFQRFAILLWKGNATLSIGRMPSRLPKVDGSSNFWTRFILTGPPLLVYVVYINNYVNCPSNTRSICVFHPPIFEKILMRIRSISEPHYHCSTAQPSRNETNSGCVDSITSQTLIVPRPTLFSFPCHTFGGRMALWIWWQHLLASNTMV